MRFQRLVPFLALCALAWAPGAAADLAGEVTAALGDVRGGEDRPVAAETRVADEERLVMGEDGKCSLLVDGDLALQLCEETVAVLRTTPDGRRIVQIDAGKARLVAEPRLSKQRIEIHTPAAVATLLGTIVHVSVDPESRVSKIASTHSKVSVRATRPGAPAPVTVRALEQVTVAPDGDPTPPKPLDPEEWDELHACAADLRDSALGADLAEDLLPTLDRFIARDAIADLDLPDAPGAPPAAPDPGPPDDRNDIGNSCTVVECGEIELRPPVTRIIVTDQVGFGN